MIDDLTGLVVLATGAGSGLGRAVADAFIKAGAHVAILEQNPEKCDALRRDHSPDSVIVHHGDAADAAAVGLLLEAVESAHGRLDSLIAFQGIWDGNTHLVEFPEAATLANTFDEVFTVNVKTFLVSAYVCAPALVRSKGTIVMTLSNAAFMPDGGGPLYVSSKHACLGLVRQLAFELAPDVRVNGVAPGGIGGSDLRGPRSLGLDRTSLAAIPADEFPQRYAVRRNPLGIRPDAADYAPLYALLASRTGSRTLTGHVIEADQGRAVRGFA